MVAACITLEDGGAHRLVVLEEEHDFVAEGEPVPRIPLMPSLYSR